MFVIVAASGFRIFVTRVTVEFRVCGLGCRLGFVGQNVETTR